MLACDVRDQASVDRAVAGAIERLGGLDVLINCAGIGDPQSAGAPPGDDALRVLDVNLLGPWRVTAAAMPALRGLARSRGQRGLRPGPPDGSLRDRLLHEQARASSPTRTRSGIEHGDAITVTTVYPGYIRTPIHDAAAAQGLSLEGAVPAERLRGRSPTLTRAALGAPKRDLATTRQGEIAYALLRLIPRGLVDFAVARQFKRGGFDQSALV